MPGSSPSNNRGGMLRRQRTQVIDKDEVDFKVLEFTCLDESYLQSVGKHSKLFQWKVSVGGQSNSKVIDIKLHVDKTALTSPSVNLVWDSKQVFPTADEKGRLNSTGVLKENLKYSHPFRGKLPNLKKEKAFKVKSSSGGDEYYPATLKEQTPCNNFVATVFLTDKLGGIREVEWPLVCRENILTKDDCKIFIPEKSLSLEVPANDPLHPVLKVDEELITHFFERPTPPPADKSGKAGGQSVCLQVNKERTQITANISSEKLQKFLLGEPQQDSESSAKMRKEWKLQLGPFSKHVIELTRSKQQVTGVPSKIFTLKVDGEALATSSAEDLDCASPEETADVWECKFGLAGEKLLEWNIYLTDSDGNPTDEKGVVKQPKKIKHELVVSCNVHEGTLSNATLSVDGKDFQDLSQYKEIRDEGQTLKVTPEAMKSTFNLNTPYKTTTQKPSGMEQLKRALQAFFDNPSDYFAKCCSSEGSKDMCLEQGCTQPPPCAGPA